MAELAPKDRLLPSLLDRLTDNQPNKKEEIRDSRLADISSLRESVLRDLEWLMNSINLEHQFNFTGDYAELKSTVINYGMPGLSGSTMNNHDKLQIQKIIKECLRSFEPRILKNTLKVNFIDSESLDNPHAIAFEIHGTLWGNPMPEALFLRTELDLEIGEIKVTEA